MRRKKLMKAANWLIDQQLKATLGLLFCSAAATAQTSATCLLTMKTVAAETQTPVVAVRIYVQGYDTEAETDENGSAEIQLPLGAHNIATIHPRFTTLRENISFTTCAQEVTFTLQPTGLDLEEFVVLAPHIQGSVASLLEEKRNSTAVADVIGSEQISRSGDSDTGSALRRVTGMTLVGGKFVYVRGLGERYSSVLLNGSSLPSPDPARRVVPLDIFPTGVLDSLFIQKSYTPDLPAEFGGGTIILRTRRVPESFSLKVDLSIGYTPGETGQMGHLGTSGKYDWLGIDSGVRQLPDSVSNATSGRQELKENNAFYAGGYSVEELERFGEDLSKNWSLHNHRTQPPASVSIAVGDRIEHSAVTLGYFGSLMYGHELNGETISKTRYAVGRDNTLVVNKRYDYDETAREVKVGSLATVGLDWGTHTSLAATTLLVRKTKENGLIATGYLSDTDAQVRETEIGWLERQLLSQQINGEHHLGLGWPSLMWFYTRSEALRDDPDRRSYRYDQEGNQWRFSTRTDGNQRTFSHLRDTTDDVRGELRWAVGQTRDLDKPWLTFRTGIGTVKKARDSEIRRFTFVDRQTTSRDSNLTLLPVEAILSAENIAPSGFQLQESTRATDNYEASQTVDSLFGSFEMMFPYSFDLLVGARKESSTQNVKTFALFDPDNSPIVAELTDKRWLPVAGLTWTPHENLIFRFTYSKTVSRPDFKELSPAPYTDDETHQEVVGNPGLQTILIKSYDIRGEFYLSGTESLSLALFIKDFEHPIESIVEPGTERRVTFANALSARNLGLELDFRKSTKELGLLFRNFTLGGNLAVIHSRIKLDSSSAGIHTNNNRMLQGQSPYVANLFFEYDNTNLGATGTLLYNVFGARIVEVGTGGAPDILEQPYNSLDFVATQSLSDKVKMRIKIKDILASDSVNTQGSEVSYRKTRSPSITLSISTSL